jgi:opacity protein-like surface antigen
MRKITFLTVFWVFIGIFSPHFLYSQEKNIIKKENKDFYLGLGTKLSSYIGGDVGDRFAIRYSNAYDPFEDNNGYYYNKDEQYYNDRQSNALNPLQLNLFGGVNLGNNFALELETGVLFHTAGNVEDGDVNVGFQNGVNYVEHYDNSSLLSIPLIASLKFYPLGKNSTSLYLSGGYGVQYISETLDRVRDYQLYNNYNYQSGTYRDMIAGYSASSWMTGFKAGVGLSYFLFGNIANDIELSYSHFTNRNTQEGSNLAIQKTPEFGNVSLGVKMYMDF